jgi:2-deoxy-D-gluconate 3-dehydrogenase
MMILDTFRIDGQVAVVTGGTKGIGRAIALALAEAGADVAAVSRKAEAEIEQQILGLGRRYVHLTADITQRDQTRAVIPAAAEALGDVDILVNNAGVIRRAAAMDYSERDWDETLEIDLTAAFILSQAAGRRMLQKGRGKIINIASVLAFQGGINVSAYASAKHGVAGLTRALANDWAAGRINVNAIAPGFIETELTEALQQDPERSKAITGRVPAGRWGRAVDIAGAVVFLASGASDYVNGIILPVDGGWLAW